MGVRCKPDMPKGGEREEARHKGAGGIISGSGSGSGSGSTGDSYSSSSSISRRVVVGKVETKAGYCVDSVLCSQFAASCRGTWRSFRPVCCGAG